jgi:hypothetical protein
MTDAVVTLWHRVWYTRLRDLLRGRWDASLDWQQLVASADLPTELTDAIQRVVRGTRLWRSEKVAVAADLLSHFQDGLAAGRTPDDLLHSFGDSQTAAQLIRRAKKRGRPMLWRIWHYGWIGSAVLVLVYVSIGVWMAAARPSVKTDYLAVLNKSALAVPDNERAWPLYRDALLALGANLAQEDAGILKLACYEARPGDEHWKDTEKALSDHADAIAKLREAAKRPNLGFVTSAYQASYSPKDRELFGFAVTPEQIEIAKHANLQDRWLISTLLPHMQLLRSSALLLASDARRAASADDAKTAFEDVIALFGISRHCAETPLLICVMVAEAVQQKSRAAIEEIIAEHPDLWTDSQLRDLAHTVVGSRIDWRRGFEGERIAFYDSMQRIYTDSGNGDGRLALHVTNEQNLFQMLDAITTGSPSNRSPYSHASVALLSLPAANMVVASRKQMTDAYEKVFTSALARVDSPYWKRSLELSSDDEVRALQQQTLGKIRYLFVMLLTPAYDKVLDTIVVSDGNRDGVFLGLALELYHREHSKWPGSLGELSPQWLPELPVDRLTGNALHYKVVNDRPVVYSVGLDGDDDGGRWAKDAIGDAHPDAAAPTHFGGKGESDRDAKRDGDWVIWSALPREIGESAERPQDTSVK